MSIHTAPEATASLSPFERIHAGGTSVFTEDYRHCTPQFNKWQALDKDTRPSWEEFRDAKPARRSAAKPLSGHANMPLNLPGSFPTPLKDKQ